MNSAPNADRLTVRWTIGDVHPRGFEMLRLSITCARRLFGASTRFVVCVNTISVEEAQRRTGDMKDVVEWRRVTANDLPLRLGPYLDSAHMEGMAWKLAPLRIDHGRWELAIDNDCILWDLPESLLAWLQADRGGLFAEDVERCLGSFDAICPPGAFNAGIRGLTPGADLESALLWAIEEAGRLTGGTLVLREEIEEQGLQAAAMLSLKPLWLVRKDEVSLCSPFWPKTPELGTCGAHFIGSNAHHIPWNYYDKPADDWLDQHWLKLRALLYAKAGLPLP